MSRRPWRAVACAVVAMLFLASGCSGDTGRDGAGDGEPDRVIFLTAFGLFGRDAYSVCAEAEGIFAEHGLAVEIQPGTGTESNLGLLLGGQADFMVTDLVSAVIALADGVEGFHAVAAVQQNNLSSWMTTDAEIQSPRDLAGRTVGLPLGAATGLLFPTYAELAGVDVDQVTVENVGPQDLPTMLATGQADAIGQFVVGQPLIEAATGQPVSVFPYTDYLPDLYGAGLVTATGTIAEDPGLVARFRDALLAGVEWSIDNPEQCGQHLAEFEESADPVVAAQELALLEPYVRVGEVAVGGLDRDRVAQMIATMEAAEAVPAGIMPEDLVDFDLVP